MRNAENVKTKVFKFIPNAELTKAQNTYNFIMGSRKNLEFSSKYQHVLRFNVLGQEGMFMDVDTRYWTLTVYKLSEEGYPRKHMLGRVKKVGEHLYTYEFKKS